MDASRVVVLPVHPDVLVVEDAIDRVVREPIDQKTRVRELPPRGDPLPVLQPLVLLPLLVPEVLLFHHARLGLGHPANGGQVVQVFRLQAQVRHLVRELLGAFLLLRELLILPFVVRQGELLCFARPLPLAPLLLALILPLPAARQVVHLPGAGLPEGDPTLLLSGHDPGMLHELYWRVRVFPPRDRALADVGLLLGAEEHGGEEQGVVLHGALPREEEGLRVFPRIDLTGAILAGGVAEGKAVDPVEQRGRLDQVLRGDDLGREGHEGQWLGGLGVGGHAREAPQIRRLLQLVREAGPRADGIGVDVQVDLVELLARRVPLLFLLHPQFIVGIAALRFADGYAFGPVGVEVRLEVDQRRLGVRNGAARELALRPVVDPGPLLLLEPLLRRGADLALFVLLDRRWCAQQGPLLLLALQQLAQGQLQAAEGVGRCVVVVPNLDVDVALAR
mmetsp:Transcript_542/g.1835  ORF Transcript_542/g.1835 Transcript_542/m.1835 type:complete len:449 (+) Transcript_542:881-2227(+)